MAGVLGIFYPQAYAVFFNRNQSVFIKIADYFFECFFADPEKIGDFLWAAFIGDRDKSTVLPNLFHNFCGQRIDGFIAGHLQAQVYLFIFTYFLDKPVDFLADL